ncbi:MAG: methyltransferase domain-containing protein [Methylophaga sp.]|jgi:SAM-dependent methyltransferase
MNQSDSKEIDRWWQSPLGQDLLSVEREMLSQLDEPLLGYFYLQLGGNESCLPHSNRTCSQYLVASTGDVLAEPEFLPFKSHSIDNLLLLHVLERSTDPHQLLREVERVLAADGKLILCCFNPFSLWGIRRLFSWQDTPPWDGHFFSQTRIRDWLALLNFEVVEQRRTLYRPPFSHAAWLQGSVFMERWGRRLWPWLGAVSVMVAAKRTIPMTPVREHWRKRRLFPAPGLVNKPLTRDHDDGSR